MCKVSPGGGHTLSSSNIIQKGIPPENFLAMVEAAREFGRCPIRLQLGEDGLAQYDTLAGWVKNPVFLPRSR